MFRLLLDTKELSFNNNFTLLRRNIWHGFSTSTPSAVSGFTSKSWRWRKQTSWMRTEARNFLSQSIWEIHAIRFKGKPFAVIAAEDSLKASSQLRKSVNNSPQGPFSGSISLMISLRDDLLLLVRLLYVDNTGFSTPAFFLLYKMKCSGLYRWHDGILSSSPRSWWANARIAVMNSEEVQ